MDALNTLVMGTPESCEHAADCLDTLHQVTQSAGTSVRAARGHLDASWDGPAHDQFDDATSDVPDGLDKVRDTGTNWARALRDFASSLRGIDHAMQGVVDKAHGAGLVVNGPFVFAPKPPGPAPVAPMCTTAQSAPQAFQQHQAAVGAYNQQVDAFNAKIRCYNECQAIVMDQRNKEENEHQTLESKFKYEPDEMDRLKTALSAGMSTKGLIAAVEGIRKQGLNLALREQAYGLILGKYAAGDANITAAQHKLLMNFMDKQIQDDANVRAAKQMDKFLKVVPASIRNAITFYPGRSIMEDAGAHTNYGRLPKLAAGFSKGMPWAGSIFSLTSEAQGALTGKQTWTHAIANAAATTGGGWVGGRLGGIALGAITGGPYGALAGTLVGGTAGGSFAKDIVTGWYQGKAEAAVRKAYSPLPELPHK